MKIITRNQLVYFGGLIGPLLFALYSQYIDGFHPCELCIWQRWAYGAAIAFFILAIALKQHKILMMLSITALAACCAIAVYQTGIEQKWWEGFQACSSAFGESNSIDDLRNMILSAPVVRCDQPEWFFVGLSMAAWNAIYTFALTIFGVFAVCRQKSI